MNLRTFNIIIYHGWLVSWDKGAIPSSQGDTAEGRIKLSNLYRGLGSGGSAQLNNVLNQLIV